jgi:hypothetical protein
MKKALEASRPGARQLQQEDQERASSA